MTLKNRTERFTPLDVKQTIKKLTLDEKISLLSGKDSWSTRNIDHHGIPSLTASDGPHGVRGTAFFNGPKACLLPSATGMGATFNKPLMHKVGTLLALECKERSIHILLGPTVCLQRSPLIGRGFEAFGEDPVLSGLLASSYINGAQENGVAICLKHYTAHDQSTWSLEDAICASERTLRELHLLPFQLAIRYANPWSIMTAYHKINGTHCSESQWLLQDVLRNDWGWNGLVMSDWFGTYSTSEAVNAGMDLEMPGPPKWRGELLRLAVTSRKVRQAAIDSCVENLLHLVNKVNVREADPTVSEREARSEQKNNLCRQVSREAIVLLKNSNKLLPLYPSADCSYALIGPAVQLPAASGGGSADLRPHYISTPLEAITEVVGKHRVKTALGAYNHLFLPLLEDNITCPVTSQRGYRLEWFNTDPQMSQDVVPVSMLISEQAQMFFGDCLPAGVAEAYWLRVTTTYRAPKTTVMQFGLCVLGRAKMYINGLEVIDLTKHPKKTMQTPMFDMASMEVTTDVEVIAHQDYEIMIVLNNKNLSDGVGAANAGGLRIGSCEKLDGGTLLAEAVKLAQSVDIPIVVAGLNADYESEALDRTDLELPKTINTLISQVIKANSNTIVVTQSGCPIAMPWIDNVATLLHAWYGGQETGNAIADVLFGKVNPSGRLSLTFPKRVEDTPTFLNFGKGTREVMYGEGVFIGYRYFEKLRLQPHFYFGFGLSYTTFQYSALAAPPSIDPSALESQGVSVRVTIANSGGLDGEEVVQLYVQDIECLSSRPRKELKAFDKVLIKAGQSTEVELILDKYAFSYWSEELNQWLAEKGGFNLIIARSADPEDEILTARIQLQESFSWSGI